jgi:hypothetical protein
VEWLLGVEPESLGVEFSAQRRAAAALAAWLARRGPEPVPDAAELLREAAESAFATAWARRRGIAGPTPDEVVAFALAWESRQSVSSREALLSELGVSEDEYRAVFAERAFFRWLLARGPRHFGYSTWSPEAALLRELQLEGGLSPLLERGVAR